MKASRPLQPGSDTEGQCCKNILGTISRGRALKYHLDIWYTLRFFATHPRDQSSSRLSRISATSTKSPGYSLPLSSRNSRGSLRTEIASCNGGVSPVSSQPCERLSRPARPSPGEASARAAALTAGGTARAVPPSLPLETTPGHSGVMRLHLRTSLRHARWSVRVCAQGQRG